MSSPDGMPIWYELMTSDPDGAQAFYEAVVGWSVAPFGGAGAGEDYRILTAPDASGVGGIMKLPSEAPMGPGWFVYFGVQDVDGTARRVTELGGKVLMPPQDIPGVGRFAMIADPQGMMSYVMRGDSPAGSTAFEPTGLGHGSWNELVTRDHVGAIAFYGALFGWQSNESMKMGPMGDYCFISHGGVPLGATMTAPPGSPTRWSFYMRVSSIASATELVTRNGGSITLGPVRVPTGDNIVLGTDPQGAAFALVGQP